ncbi:MAG TPA: MFS transporter [Chthoniobacterales bacterium]|nr:MFS transporter [Chthoniobacterales bacterium]
MQLAPTIPAENRVVVEHDRLALFAGSAGIFLSTLDSGIMNVALPSLCNALNCDFHAITLAVTLYMATIGSTIVLFGRLADHFGQVVLLGIGFFLFGIASTGCALSAGLTSLVAWRAAQGLGAAMMQASAAATITTIVREIPVPIALGIFGTFLGLGPVLGPTVGGILLSTVGWPWIFWINLPICAAGAYCTFRLSPYARRNRSVTISPLRNGCLMIGVISLLFLLQSSNNREWRMSGLLSGVGVVGVSLFVWLERAAITKPLIPRAFLSSGRNVASLWIVLCYGVAFAILFLLPPLFLGKHYHLAPWQIGCICFCAPLGIALTSRIAGDLTLRFGTCRMMMLGAIASTAALLLIALAHTTILWIWPPLLLLFGIGYGVYQTPNLTLLMHAVTKREQGIAGSIQRMLLNLGNSVGGAVAAFLLNIQSGEQDASFGATWWFAALFLATGLLGLLVCCQGDKTDGP